MSFLNWRKSGKKTWRLLSSLGAASFFCSRCECDNKWFLNEFLHFPSSGGAQLHCNIEFDSLHNTLRHRFGWACETVFHLCFQVGCWIKKFFFHFENTTEFLFRRRQKIKWIDFFASFSSKKNCRLLDTSTRKKVFLLIRSSTTFAFRQFFIRSSQQWRKKAHQTWRRLNCSTKFQFEFSFFKWSTFDEFLDWQRTIQFKSLFQVFIESNPFSIPMFYCYGWKKKTNIHWNKFLLAKDHLRKTERRLVLAIAASEYFSKELERSNLVTEEFFQS